jgi:hypothetical protein
MNGKDFIKAVKKWARANNRECEVFPKKGKGGHQQIRVSPNGLTTVKSGEVGKGLKEAMLKQLRMPKDAF